MATINSRNSVDKIIRCNGYWEEDGKIIDDEPRVIKIVEYTNNWGGQSYGLIFDGEDLNRYNASAFIHNPKTIWEVK